jgi:hypothetical protein
MMGRCGRDGRPGLAILFMEEKRKKGKNSVNNFNVGKKELTDDDRMDAYAVTPVCLRVASAADNRCASFCQFTSGFILNKYFFVVMDTYLSLRMTQITWTKNPVKDQTILTLASAQTANHKLQKKYMTVRTCSQKIILKTF